MNFYGIFLSAILAVCQACYIFASVPVCITNCVQCKQMFGPYFQGRACGDGCLSSNGRLTPDCNNPGTLGNYLKRFY